MSISSVTNSPYTPPLSLARAIGDATSLFSTTPTTQAAQPAAGTQASVSQTGIGGMSFSQIAGDLQAILLQAQGSETTAGSQATAGASQNSASQTAAADPDDPTDAQSTTDSTGAVHHHHHHHHRDAGAGNSNEAPGATTAGSAASQALQAYAAAAGAIGTGASLMA
jgi:hypothetical protein